MHNTELITTIISVILTIVSAVLGYLSKKSSKAKTYYETFIKVEEQIKKLCITAESSYTKGYQKKKYVIASINQFLIDNGLTIETEVIDTIIESVIDVSNKINKTE